MRLSVWFPLVGLLAMAAGARTQHHTSALADLASLSAARDTQLPLVAPEEEEATHKDEAETSSGILGAVEAVVASLTGGSQEPPAEENQPSKPSEEPVPSPPPSPPSAVEPTEPEGTEEAPDAGAVTDALTTTEEEQQKPQEVLDPTSGTKVEPEVPEEAKPLTKSEKKAVNKYNEVTDQVLAILSNTLAKVEPFPLSLDESALSALEAEPDTSGPDAEPEPEPEPESNPKKNRKKKNKKNRKNKNKRKRGEEIEEEEVEEEGQRKKNKKKKKNKKNKDKRNRGEEVAVEEEEEDKIVELEEEKEVTNHNKKNKRGNKNGGDDEENGGGRKKKKKNNKNNKKRKTGNEDEEEEEVEEVETLEEEGKKKKKNNRNRDSNKKNKQKKKKNKGRKNEKKRNRAEEIEVSRDGRAEDFEDGEEGEGVVGVEDVDTAREAKAFRGHDEDDDVEEVEGRRKKNKNNKKKKKKNGKKNNKNNKKNKGKNDRGRTDLGGEEPEETGPVYPTEEERSTSNAYLSGLTYLSRTSDVTLGQSTNRDVFTAQVTVGPLVVQLKNQGRALKRSQVTANLDAQITFKIRTKGRRMQVIKVKDVKVGQLTPAQITVARSDLDLEPEVIDEAKSQVLSAVDPARVGRIINSELDAIFSEDDHVENLQHHKFLTQ